MKRANGDGTIYRRADHRYEAKLYVPARDGSTKRISVYATSRAGIEKKLAAARERACQGLPAAADQSLADFLDYWLPIVKRTKRPTTYLSYESIIRNYLKPGLGTKRLTKLSVRDVQRHLDAQLAAGCGTRTVQKQRTVLSAALTRARREELIIRNVARLAEVPESQRKEITPWTVEDIAVLFNAAKDHPLYPAFVLLALYGLRAGELLGLTWDDVDFAAGQIHIRQQLQRYEGAMHLLPPKTRAGRRDLPLLELARGVLLAHREHRTDHPWNLVFTTRFNNPIEEGNLNRSLTRIIAKAGLRRITPHHLRHTTATLLKNLGVPDRDAQLILGHAHITTTQQVYQHGDSEGQRAGLASLQQQFQLASDRSGCRQNKSSTARQIMFRPISDSAHQMKDLVAPPRLELGTQGSSGLCSTTELKSQTEVHGLVAVGSIEHVLGAAVVKLSRQAELGASPDAHQTALAELHRALHSYLNSNAFGFAA